MSDALEQTIRNIVKGCLQIECNLVDLDDQDLRKQGLSSIRIVELVLKIQDEFNIDIPEDYLLAENFTTTRNIIFMVKNIKGLNNGKRIECG